MSYFASSDQLPEWARQIPSGWGRDWVKWSVSLSTARPDEDQRMTLPYLSNEDIASWTGKLLREELEPLDVDSRLFEPGDVLFNKLRPYLAKVFHANFAGASSGELLCLRPSNRVDARYLFYVLTSFGFIDAVDSHSFGSKMPRADWETVGHQPLPLPDIEVQQRIARFLDEKTACIDALIAKKQALLERLVEKRQALITKAVTKGLNPDVPMKPSGVGCLGEIPAHWDLKRLRFNVRANPVKSELDLPDDVEVSFVPMDAVGVLGGLRLEHVRELGDVYNGYTYFANGDVCIAKITPCFENGKGAIAEGLTNGVAFGTTELHVLRPSTKLDARFLFYLTIAHDFRNHGESEMLGAGGQKRVPENFLKNWMSPLPSIEEQQFIVCLLDEEIARIDALIEKLGGRDSTAGGDQHMSLLGLLSEYRSALITAAVTGQLAELNG